LILFVEGWTYKPIVDWTDLSKNFPWATMILLGAGLSIAHASKVYYHLLFFLTLFVFFSNKVSKLLDIFGNALEFVHSAPPLIVLISVIIISELCTQLISNLSIGILKTTYCLFLPFVLYLL
jgi:hypothetical protein